MRAAILNALKTYANPPPLSGNIVTNPYDLTAAGWDSVANMNRTANSGLAPDGSMAATLLVPNTTSNANHVISDTAVGTTTAVPWLLRARFKAAGYNYGLLLVSNDNSYTKYVFAQVDIAGARIAEFTGVTYPATARARVLRLRDRWVLVEIALVPDANSSHRIDVHTRLVPPPGYAYSGDNVSGGLVWGVEFAPAPN